MAIETKASVAIDNLSASDAEEIFRLFGWEPVESPIRLYGGYASSNFKVVGKRGRPDGDAEEKTWLLKINYYGLSLEDADHQLFVMDHLRTSNFPTNYPRADPGGAFLVESGGRRAMLLDFILGGTPGQEVLAGAEAKAPRLLQELGATLARLHGVSWPSEPVLRDIRCGYPVCNTGDLLKGEDLDKLEADERFAGHPFVAFARESLPWFRELYERDVPWGFIHGDGFLDNTLYDAGPEGAPECKLLALVDWEDSCVGPFVLDLAVSASACCFTASNELLRQRLVDLVRGYEAARPLLPEERGALLDYMAAGALACAFYRFCEFNVRQSDADPQARDSYRLMFERARELRSGGGASEVIASVLQEAAQ